MSDPNLPLAHLDLQAILQHDLGLQVKPFRVCGMDTHGSTCNLSHGFQRAYMVRMTMREKNAINRRLAYSFQNPLGVSTRIYDG